ncbi:MAG: hypothetical protein K5669_07730 [Lachnospiraceae bacterium]|nr:hypothetical protein [Lachnospiraceae bacterium]
MASVKISVSELENQKTVYTKAIKNIKEVAGTVRTASKSIGDDKMFDETRKQLSKMAELLEVRAFTLEALLDALSTAVSSYKEVETKNVSTVSDFKAHKTDFYGNPVQVSGANSGTQNINVTNNNVTNNYVINNYGTGGDTAATQAAEPVSAAQTVSAAEPVSAASTVSAAEPVSATDVGLEQPSVNIPDEITPTGDVDLDAMQADAIAEGIESAAIGGVTGAVSGGVAGSVTAGIVGGAAGAAAGVIAANALSEKNGASVKGKSNAKASSENNGKNTGAVIDDMLNDAKKKLDDLKKEEADLRASIDSLNQQ